MSGAALQSNVRSRPGRDEVGSKHAHTRRAHRKNERGFTLVELLIVITIVPIIIGALAGGLLEVFSLQAGTANRLSDSADAQVISSTFIKDVQSAAAISTNPNTASQCGTGTQLLELEWGNSQVIVSYSEVQNGTKWTLVRDYCSAGPSQTPSSSSTISYDLLPPCPIADSIATCTASKLQPAPIAYAGTTVINTSTSGSPAGTPVSTVGMTDLQFPISEPGSSFAYQLSATPAGGASTAETNLGLPQTGSACGFALPGTGDFANTMCFVGFSSTSKNPQIQNANSNSGNMCTNTDPGQAGVDVYADVPGGYLMSFCLTVTGSGMTAVTTPVGGGTCGQGQGTGCPDSGAVSNGQGFLGNLDKLNNGVTTPFYAGIGCAVSTPLLQGTEVQSSCISPAIFQTDNGGTNTVTLSNIKVTDPQGNPATGYEVITADAETIDPGGNIIWTSSLPSSKPLPFNLVPNFSSSDLGNACNEVPTSGYTGATGWAVDDGDSTGTFNGTTLQGGLSGLGTDSVECQSNWQTGSPYLRTGTAMIGITPPIVGGSTEPVTISASLKGEGYNAVAFGLLLP
jgi:prepilin-type N-terminal cleavage/methylation domain-containing protein